MKLLQHTNPIMSRRGVTHADHNGRPMCGETGTYRESEGDQPTCRFCLIHMMVLPRTNGKIGKRGYNETRTNRKQKPDDHLREATKMAPQEEPPCQ